MKISKVIQKLEWKSRCLILFWASCRENKRWNERGVEKFWEDTSLCDLVSCRQRARKKVWGIELFDHSLERGQVPPSSFHWARNRQKSLHYYVNNKTWANVDEQILWCKDFSSLLWTRMFLKRGALFLLLHKRCLFRQECLEPFNRYAQNQAWNGEWKVTSLWSAIRKTPKNLGLIRAGFPFLQFFLYCC